MLFDYKRKFQSTNSENLGAPSTAPWRNVMHGYEGLADVVSASETTSPMK